MIRFAAVDAISPPCPRPRRARAIIVDISRRGDELEAGDGPLLLALPREASSWHAHARNRPRTTDPSARQNRLHVRRGTWSHTGVHPTVVCGCGCDDRMTRNEPPDALPAQEFRDDARFEAGDGRGGTLDARLLSRPRAPPRHRPPASGALRLCGRLEHAGPRSGGELQIRTKKKSIHDSGRLAAGEWLERF